VEVQKFKSFQQAFCSPSHSTKCLTFGHWLTLCTLNIHLLTYLLTWVQICGGPAPLIFPVARLGAILTNLDFDRKYPKKSRYRQAHNGVINYTVFQKSSTRQAHINNWVNSQMIFKFLHWYTPWKICDKTIVKGITTPKTCRCTTLWNINFQKLLKPKHSNRKLSAHELKKMRSW